MNVTLQTIQSPTLGAATKGAKKGQAGKAGLNDNIRKAREANRKQASTIVVKNQGSSLGLEK
jgi:hypothetical protein